MAIRAAEIVGKLAPHFALPGTGGRVVDLWASKQRKNLVIYFFRSDLPVCRKGLSDFASNYFRYRALEAEVVGISTEDLGVLRRVARELSLPFQLLFDEGGRISDRYKIDLGRKSAELAVFVLDKFNSIEKVYELSEQEAPDQKEILETLEHIQALCPE